MVGREPLMAYASHTGTIRNVEALRGAGWGLLLTPGKPRGVGDMRYGCDNGAWGAYMRKVPFDGVEFCRLLDRAGERADFVVVPDIVAGGMESLKFSLSWLPKLVQFKLPLLPVQDGMDLESVARALVEYPTLGVFCGGSTKFKMSTMCLWGMMASTLKRHYHIGRVNTARRIRMSAVAGAHSFDGTSATMYSKTLPLLERTRQESRFISPIGCYSEIYAMLKRIGGV